MNPVPATASGVPVRRDRVLAFGVGAAFGVSAVPCWCSTRPSSARTASTCSAPWATTRRMVGGMRRRWPGGIVGAALLTGVPWLLATYSLRMSQNLVFGGLLLLVTFLAPGGAAPALRAALESVVVVDDVAPEPRRDRRRAGARRPVNGGDAWSAQGKFGPCRTTSGASAPGRSTPAPSPTHHRRPGGAHLPVDSFVFEDTPTPPTCSPSRSTARSTAGSATRRSTPSRSAWRPSRAASVPWPPPRARRRSSSPWPAWPTPATTSSPRPTSTAGPSPSST